MSKSKRKHKQFYCAWIPFGWEDYWVVRWNKENNEYIKGCIKEMRKWNYHHKNTSKKRKGDIKL